MNVFEWLQAKGLADRLTEHTETIDTVEHAAMRIGCSEAEIAKTLSFLVDEKPVIVVTAGDARINSSKFKARFHTKPHMVPRDQVEELEMASEATGWCDVCKGWEEEENVLSD